MIQVYIKYNHVIIWIEIFQFMNAIYVCLLMITSILNNIKHK